ncbi:MAG: NAD(+)/NADH kinase [Thermomicrobiales bacterium]|jgi:NAD+ kinase
MPQHTPPEIFAIVPARGKADSHALAPQIHAWLHARGYATIDEASIRRGEPADALVALGGDGLMMRMAHNYPGMPLLGINFGKVGFLAMTEQLQWPEVLNEIVNGDFDIQDGPTLDARVGSNDEVVDVGWAINDVVVRSGIQMVDIELYVDGRYVNTYPGDGMIVASPQGSTAYCMAAGGPILTAGVSGFAITPISPHSPIRSTLVVPEDSRIEMVMSSEREAHLILDGQITRPLACGELVRVTHSPHRFRLIMTEQMNFYAAFQSKFNYLIRPGAVPSLGHVRHEE